MSLKPFFVLGVGCFVCAAWAEPNVLHDSGNTVPIDQFINVDSSVARALKPSIKNTPGSDSSSTLKTEPIKIDEPTALPIQTQSLSVGKVKKRQVNIPDLKTPVCVVGSDEQSLNWLATNRDQLARIGARCLLIQAENQADIDRIKKQAEGLHVITAPGNAMTDSFGLQHYPALISKKWIEQ